jgi:hypothetical protein
LHSALSPALSAAWFGTAGSLGSRYPRRVARAPTRAVWLSHAASERSFAETKAMLIIARMFAALMLLGLASVQARDDGRYANSPLKSWFESLHSKNGLQCCADADGMVLADVDWDTKDGHYRVRLDGEWVVVPDDRVITEANRTGRPMVWPQYMNGNPVVRCFMPGNMT